MALFALLYVLLLFCAMIASGFVVFHLLRYSLKPQLATPTVIVFTAVIVILGAINVISFTQIPFDELTIFSTL